MRGFTLLELLVVLVIVGLATAGVALSLRDSEASTLEREAMRLTTLLEAARHHSRATGTAIHLQLRPLGFELVAQWVAHPDNADLRGPKTWLSDGTFARMVEPPDSATWVLGPEPILPRQVLMLQRGSRQLVIGTDGFKPFAVQASP